MPCSAARMNASAVIVFRLARLHGPCSTWKFHSSSGPPAATGMMWSTWTPARSAGSLPCTTGTSRLAAGPGGQEPGPGVCAPPACGVPGSSYTRARRTRHNPVTGHTGTADQGDGHTRADMRGTWRARPPGPWPPVLSGLGPPRVWICPVPPPGIGACSLADRRGLRRNNPAAQFLSALCRGLTHPVCAAGRPTADRARRKVGLGIDRTPEQVIVHPPALWRHRADTQPVRGRLPAH